MIFIPLALTSLGLTGAPLAAGQPIQEEGSPPRYVQLVESEGGRVLHLQIAVRRFTREGAPEVQLAGAVHIAQTSFYKTLQKRLDALDLVLFERVKPAGTGQAEHDLYPPDDEMRVKITEGRIRFLAGAIFNYRKLVGALPPDLESLAKRLPADIAALVKNVQVDAWGRPLSLVAGSARLHREFDLQSLGADGRIGGQGVDADLCFSDQADLTDGELGKSGEIQADLAEAMGLVFQLDAMNHAGANWQNSDLSVDQVETRLARSGASADEIFGSVSGESILADAAGFVIKLLSRFSYGSAALKLVGVELLARADELLAQAPGEMKELLNVLLIDRNRAVIADLKRALASSPELRTIGIIYGAAHMIDLEQRITSELGYRFADQTWSDAVTLDLNELGIDRGDARFMRRMIREGMERQLSGW